MDLSYDAYSDESEVLTTVVMLHDKSCKTCTTLVSQTILGRMRPHTYHVNTILRQHKEQHEKDPYQAGQ